MQIARLFATIGADLSPLEKGLFRAESRLARTAGVMRSVGKKLSMGLTLPIIAVGAVTVKMAASFDQSMRNVNAILGKSEAGFQDMKQEVLDFSLTTRASANDVAKSLQMVAAAGFRGSDAMLLMEKSGRAAGAAFTTAESMANLLISAINSYGLEVSEADRLTDLFIYATQQGAGSIDELSAELGTVFPTARAAGISITEMTAAVTMLHRRGLNTAVATTALNQAIMRIIAPSEELSAVFQKAGYSSSRAAMDALGFAGVMKLVEEATGGSAEKLKLLFPNMRAMRAVLNLAAGQAGELAEKVEEFGTAAEGAMERARVQQYASLESQLKRLKSAFEVLGITIGNEMIPRLTTLVDDLIPKVRTWIMDLTKEQINNALKWAAIAAAIGPVLIVGSALISVVTALAKGAVVLYGAIVALPALISSMGVAFSLMAASGGGLAAANLGGVFAMASMGGAGLLAVLGPLATALGAVALAYHHFITKTKTEGREAVSGAWTKFFDDMIIKGKDAREIADEYAKAQARVQDSLDNTSGAVRFLMGDLDKLFASTEEINAVLLKTSDSYYEYFMASQKAGLGADALSEHQYNLHTGFENMGDEVKQQSVIIDAWAAKWVSAHTDVVEVTDETATALENATGYFMGLEVSVDDAAEAMGDYEHNVLKGIVGAQQAAAEKAEELAKSIKTVGDAFREARSAIWSSQQGFVRDLMGAYEDLETASGEWVTVYSDHSGEIGDISSQLAADLADDQRDAFRDLLPTVAEGSAEWLNIWNQLQGDLTESQRNSLVAQLADLQGTHGQFSQVWSGDAKAAEDAQGRIDEALEAIAQSYRTMVYNAIFASNLASSTFTEDMAATAVAMGVMTQDVANMMLNVARVNQFAIDEADRLAELTPAALRLVVDAFSSGEADSFTGALLIAQEEMLETRVAAMELTGELGKLPGEIDLMIIDNFEDAKLRAALLKTEIDKIPTSVTVNVHTVGEIGGGGVQRQHGGPVFAGQLALVGEAGPELFIPRQSGQIIPHQQTQEMLAGAETHYHLNVTSTEGAADIAADFELMRIIGQ